MAPFVAQLGRPPVGVIEFAENSDWTHMLNSIGWGLSCWSSTPYRIAQSVPMLMSTGTLADGAQGAYDAQFVALGDLLVAKGYSDAYLRIGWEMNGDWYRWAAAQDPTNWKRYFQRIVLAMRSVKGQHFKIIWNPAIGQQQIGSDQIYPGDDYVDVIGLDVYNQSWNPADTDPATRWANLVEQPYGLDWLKTFAGQHKKPIALPEWGTGTRPDGHGFGDDPMFIDNMAIWIADNNVVMQGYWDYNAGDYNADFEEGPFPDAAAAYTNNFAVKP